MIHPVRTSGEIADTGAPSFHNLLMSLSELGTLLPDALRRASWLDAYLLGAGMNQIAEDYLHRDPFLFGAVGDHLLSSGGRAHAIAGRSAEAAASIVQAARIRRQSSRGILRWQRSLASLIDTLADVVAEVVLTGRSPAGGPIDAAEAIASSIDSLPPPLQTQVLRLPSCFQTFDLEPADILAMARKFMHSWPNRSRPLLVAGVRTSGSYLAPLAVAFLKGHGYGDVLLLTMRPQHQLFGHERAVVHAVARRGGLALVIDDPPGSGRSVARVADALHRLDVPEKSIVPLLPLFGGPDRLPPVLRRYPSVLLGWEEWAIRSTLTTEAVGRALNRLLAPDARVEDVQPLPLPPRHLERSHERALFRVSLVEGNDRQALPILVQGVGIGYYGEHARAVAQALEGYVPDVYGVEHGCLYREWLPEERRACSAGRSEDAALLGAVATYVVDRSRALPVAHDASTGLTGQQPAWEVVSHILSRAFGRGAPAARLVLTDALAKRVLEVARPSVVDGCTSLSNWFVDERKPNGYLKTAFVERSFWNLGLTCYDAVFDLAGAAVSSSEQATAEELRSAYEHLTGEPVDEERWFLYKLAQLWGRERVRADASAELRRASARALQCYIARVYLADLEPNASGPVCAIDLDGVLDTQALGFPGTTSSGGEALRALIAHGYRPVLVSGRSVDEIADRCLSYRLDGGVAEYGAVVYTAATRQTHILLSDTDLLLLSRLRAALSKLKGVCLDPAYRHSVRAFRTDRAGRRRALGAGTIAAALASVEIADRLQPIAGADQTDFVVAGIDKGTGIQALVGRIGSRRDSEKPLALAVGDTAADLPMLNLATLAFAPANADTFLRGANVRVLAAPYQAGLLLAVERLIGHRPGGCASCRVPRLTPEATLLLGLISAQERGRFGLAERFLQLHASARALRRREAG
jgi:hydroxymethylpyrimidine pyrophosphatase-like HAD family hydrolase